MRFIFDILRKISILYLLFILPILLNNRDDAMDSFYFLQVNTQKKNQ
jgi:hypothetical protein